MEEEQNIAVSAESIVYSDIPYAEHFIAWADTAGWQWEWLAAIAYQESKFNSAARSHRGASGLMQIMPATARRYGLNDSTVFIPKENIRAGALYLRHLRNSYSFIQNEDEQRRFVLASYNGGIAHIMDARRLAKKYGRSPYVWYDNTAYWLERLKEPDIAADSVVLYGAFNPYETLNYVKRVEHTFKHFVTKKTD